MDLPEILLKLAAAAGGGVDSLLRETSSVLREAAPFDAAEVAIARPLGFERWTLTDSVEPVAAEDVLFHVMARREALRLDDLEELAGYPRTLEKMRAQGLQSLLVLPTNAAGGCEGAIVLGRRFGWAFVGVSLRVLWGVVGMTGLLLEQSIRTATLTRELENRRIRGDAAQPPLAPPESEPAQLAQEPSSHGEPIPRAEALSSEATSRKARQRAARARGQWPQKL